MFYLFVGLGLRAGAGRRLATGDWRRLAATGGGWRRLARRRLAAQQARGAAQQRGPAPGRGSARELAVQPVLQLVAREAAVLRLQRGVLAQRRELLQLPGRGGARGVLGDNKHYYGER